MVFDTLEKVGYAVNYNGVFIMLAKNTTIFWPKKKEAPR